MVINLDEFMDWYKKSEIEYKWKKWVFREPRIKDIRKPILELLEIGCLEWDWNEFKEILEKELPFSKRKEFIDKVLEELGLELELQK